MSALKRKIEEKDDGTPAKIAKLDEIEESANRESDEEMGSDHDLEEDEDDEDDDLDEDGYEDDDFLVKEDEDVDEKSSLKDDENASQASFRKKVVRKKLKKNTNALVLDEDDQLLIQETLNSSIQKAKEPIVRTSEFENEIAPDDVGEDSDLNDFIEDDYKPQGEKTALTSRRTRRLSHSRRDGPTYDQIQEAREIFGDGYDELGDNFDEVDEFEEGGEFASDEKKNFFLDEDEDIRRKDEPERLQMSAHATRPTNNEELKEESIWISYKLSLSINISELAVAVEAVLRFLLIEKLEIPFIWLYRRDYLLSNLRREDLWRIYWLDARWYEMARKQRKLLQRCSLLEGDITHSRSAAAEIMTQFPTHQYLDFIRDQMSEVVLQDATSYLTLLCEGHSFVPGQREKSFEQSALSAKEGSKRENSKLSKYRKYKSMLAVQQIASSICVKAHEVGFSLLRSTPPQVPQVVRSWEEEASDLIAATDLRSISHLLSAATIVIGTELCHEPIIRHFARAVFKNRASISTFPTNRGKSIITPFSQYFGIHLIENKPLEQFFSEEGLRLFMTMIEAESSGLIEISINPPQKRDGDRLVQDLEPFFADRLRLFQFFMPPIPADQDPNPQLRFSWDIVRLNVLQATVEKYLIPFLKSDARSELLRQGKELILEESCREFEKRIAIGPCGASFEDNREFIANALLTCPERSRFSKVVALYVSQDQSPGVHLAAVDSNGILIGQYIIPSQSMGQRKDKIKAFLYEHRPDLIVVNAGGLATSRDIFHLVQKSVLQEICETIELDRQLKRSQNSFVMSDDEEEEAEGEAKYSPKVMMIADAVPNILKNSSRRDSSLIELSSDTVAAVSLARFAQEPLSEYCNLWKTVDSSYLFGFEALFLNLHPLQKHVLREKLVERLEVCLVNAVSDVGVDINRAIKFEHHATLLAFVPGLGLRKAEALRQQILRSVGHVDSREALLTKKFLGKVVWNNCCGFLKIKSENPLETTRIHPECYLMYDFAPKICADALDVECNPSRYSDIVLKLMKSVRHDLEKRIHKVPEWLDKWESGKPEYFIEGAETSLLKNSSRISIELQDCLSALLLDEYVQELEHRGKGKRRIQFEQIKEELRYPFLDLRRPMANIAQSELFDLLYGESQYSLFVGLKLGFTVLETQDQTFYEEQNNLRRHQRTTVKTDNGIRGFIHPNEVFDDDRSSSYSQISDRLRVGDHLVGTVVAIQKERFSLELSIKASVLEHSEVWWMQNRSTDLRARRYWEQLGKNPARLFDRYFNEKAALEIISTQEEVHKGPALSWQQQQQRHSATLSNQVTARVIYHPLFANIDYRGAEEKLRNERKGTGAVLIRPSSRGPNYLALTWAFQENWFKHINIEELGKRPNDLGLGSKLLIREGNLSYEFSDLDELYAMFIEPMNDLVSAMTKHKNFRYGTPEIVEQDMRDQLKTQPGRIPYFIRFDPQKPGVFVLTWMSVHSSKTAPQVKSLKIDVQPKGYRIGNEMFSRPSELILWFKKMNERR